MKKRKTLIAGFPKEWSDYLNSSGFLVKKGGHWDGMEVCLAGEDLKHNVIWVAFKDFPRWLEAGVNMEIQMPFEDFKRMVKYFRKVDLRKHRMKRMLVGKFTEFKAL
jgi:hypothetical protein